MRHYDVKFVLKTDDDAFIYVAPLVAQLRALCEHPDCEGERIYMGRMAHHSEVLLQQGHKWNNDIFYNHTGGWWCSFWEARLRGGPWNQERMAPGTPPRRSA